MGLRMPDSATAAPVFKVDPVPPPRYSMSYLRAAGDCLRRAHFERIESTAGRDATIGRIWHEVAATVGFAVTMRGDTHPHEGEALRIARRVMSTPEGEPDPLSREVWDEVLDLSARWERWAKFNPADQFEIDMRNDLAGRTISARLDRLRVEDGVAHITDYKTGWSIPPGRPEPTPQGDIYGWSVWRAYGVERVIFTEDHIRFGPGQPFEYDLDAILLVDEWLHDAVARIDAAYERGGELPTNPGDACGKWGGCPVARDCPVKQWARPAGEITGEADAVAHFEALLVEEASVTARKKALQAWLKSEGHRALVLNGQEIGWAPEAGTSTDWKALATSLGGDPKDFTSTKAPSFGRRKSKEGK